MAFLKHIAATCQRCGSPARVELFNLHNASLGVYCRACGQAELESQIRLERERQLSSQR